MNKIKLYYLKNCPACEKLEFLLKQKKIKYRKCKNIKLMLRKGFNQVPHLEINNIVLTNIEVEKFLRGEYIANNKKR